MKKLSTNQKGFTLVELAIVMIIIGLLIGGILKGQELIANAQVSASVAQVKGINGAVSTFRDSYQALPGDMSNATIRLPNCAAPCANGTGDNIIGSSAVPVGANTAGAGAAPAAGAAGEPGMFWNHLNRADLVTGVTGTTVVQWGEAFPASNVGGGFVVGSEPAGNVANRTATAAGRGGLYLVMRAAPAVAAPAAAGQGVITGTQAARIDRKIDDGGPNTGSVLGIGAAAAVGCASSNAPGGIYNEAAGGQDCSLAFRIQG